MKRFVVGLLYLASAVFALLALLALTNARGGSGMLWAAIIAWVCVVVYFMGETFLDLWRDWRGR